MKQPERVESFVQVSLRVEKWVIEAADAYAVTLAEQSAVRARRADALRVLLKMGIESLQEGGPKKKKRK